jgi:hypothetical protein
MSKSNIVPYRYSNNITVYNTDKPTFGLIRSNTDTPKPPKKHYCNYPGYLYCIWLKYFCFNPIKNGSLWRCGCGQVFEYVNITFSEGDNVDFWNETKSEDWIKAGGEI